MKHILRYFILFLLFLSPFTAGAQKFVVPDADSLRLERIRTQLDALAAGDPAYGEAIDISVGKMSLSEMLRNVAKVGNVNLSVKGAESMQVTVNFSRARITDLLYFLCKEYGLDIDIVGNIIAIKPLPTTPVPPKIPDVSYAIGRGLSYDLSGDKLIDVVKRITALTGTNIVVPQGLYAKQVSGFVSDMPMDEAIGTFASVNGIEARKEKNGVWEFSEPPVQAGGQPGQAARYAPAYSRTSVFGPNQLSIDSLGLITAQIGRGNIQDIVTDLCEKQQLNYFFVAPVSGQTSIYVRQVTFETLLGVLFAGTQNSYYVENSIYMFGQQGGQGGQGGLTAARVIPLANRSVAKLDEVIPDILKQGLQIKVFPDLNSIIASGDQRQALRVEAFLRSIDKRVPLVTIEVIIADVTKSDIKEAGIGMGLGEAPVAKTTGTLSPGVNMTLNANSVNKLINSFNGFGSINLGKVTPDFYMTLKFLEDHGNITLHSTPKLSTLNGHEASLKSGEKQYYKEIINSYFGSQTPIQNESYTWKDVEANLNIKIVPFVSADKHITLDIEIEQSEFTTRVEKEGPPGTSTRSFKSQIRIQNEEMVLLGGIDRNSVNKTSSGLPYIARIPVLKWLFGNTTDNKTDHKLNVFIKPTLID